eukprot:317137-Chlamydomonas_euryale.AAC.4
MCSHGRACYASAFGLVRQVRTCSRARHASAFGLVRHVRTCSCARLASACTGAHAYLEALIRQQQVGHNGLQNVQQHEEEDGPNHQAHIGLERAPLQQRRLAQQRGRLARGGRAGADGLARGAAATLACGTRVRVR